MKKSGITANPIDFALEFDPLGFHCHFLDKLMTRLFRNNFARNMNR